MAWWNSNTWWFIGGFIAGVIVCKVKNLNPFQIGDIVAPSTILAQWNWTLG